MSTTIAYVAEWLSDTDVELLVLTDRLAVVDDSAAQGGVAPLRVWWAQSTRAADLPEDGPHLHGGGVVAGQRPAVSRKED